jgi:hypothetical protein
VVAKIIPVTEIIAGPGRRNIPGCTKMAEYERWALAGYVFMCFRAKLSQNQGISCAKCVVAVAFWRWSLMAGVFVLYTVRECKIWS